MFGLLLETAFFGYIQREYPELGMKHSPKWMDKKCGIDFLLQVNGRTIPVGVTANCDWYKMYKDAAKAFRIGRLVQIVFQFQSLDTDDLEIFQCFDQAAEWLLNDLPDLYQSVSYPVLIVSKDEVKLEELKAGSVYSQYIHYQDR